MLPMVNVDTPINQK